MQSSTLTSTKFTESIDKKTLEKLLANKELLTTWTDDLGIERDDKKQLVNIYQGITNGKLEVNYSFSKSSPKFGRIYPKNNLSLGACQRNIRGTLTHGTYIDIDIVNAHPNMILKHLMDFGLNHKIYKKYCCNRDEYINLIKLSALSASSTTNAKSRDTLIKSDSWNLPRERLNLCFKLGILFNITSKPSNGPDMPNFLVTLG